MKFLLFGALIGGLYYSPIYLTEKYVQPQLDTLKYEYSHAEEIANKAAGTDSYAAYSSGL